MSSIQSSKNERAFIAPLAAILLGLISLFYLIALQHLLSEELSISALRNKTYRRTQAALFSLSQQMHTSNPNSEIILSNTNAALSRLHKAQLPLENSAIAIIINSTRNKYSALPHYSLLARHAREFDCFFSAKRPTSRLRRCLKDRRKGLVFFEYDLRNFTFPSIDHKTFIVSTGSIEIDKLPKTSVSSEIVAADSIRINDINCPIDELEKPEPAKESLVLYSAAGDVYLPSTAAACLENCSVSVISAANIWLAEKPWNKTQNCRETRSKPYWTKHKPAGAVFSISSN